MNSVNEAPQTIWSDQKSTAKILVVKNKSDDRSHFSKWLRGAGVAARIFFFMAVGAVAILLERLLFLIKSAEGDRVQVSSIPSKPRNDRAHPERIKVPVLPIDNYNQLDAAQVISLLTGLSHEQLRLIRSHEARQKNRGEVLGAIDRLLADGG